MNVKYEVWQYKNGEILGFWNKILLLGEGVKRRLTSRGAIIKAGRGESGVTDERQRLIAPHGNTLGNQGPSQRYMSTSESEHDIIIEKVCLFQF